MRADDKLNEANILVVDDQEANVRLLERILERAGYTNVATTTDPRLVLSLYAQFEPDLIVLDLVMPHMDGFEIMEELGKRVPEGTYLPVLVLTADVTPQARQRALSMGARDFLTKPFDHDEALLRIRNLLETRSLHLRLKDQNEALEEKVRQRTEALQRSLEVLQRTAEQRKMLLAHLARVNRLATAGMEEALANDEAPSDGDGAGG
ncbi:MAG TPA: response regulator [Actinomycetota bacterium]|nr:response regulator [Actinomycetota bacterium]